MNTNNQTHTQQTNLFRLLKNTGRFFIPVTIAAIQIPIFPGALIGAIIIKLNTNLTVEQLKSSGWIAAISIIIGYILSIVYSQFITRTANARLDQWQKTGKLDDNPEKEKIAWKQITSLPWRYGTMGALIILFVDIAPVLLYQYFSLKIGVDQTIYSLLGSLAPAVIVIVVAILSLERMLVPAREILLPHKFENQIKASTSSYILRKFLLAGLALIGITALLLAPIGYRQTYTAIYETIGSAQLFYDLRTQLISASFLAVIIGVGVSVLLSRSFTIPIDSLIQTFIKVEKGDLSERARVLASDEIGELAIYFNRMISRLDELQQTLEKRVDERTEQLRASNQVGQIASTIRDPDELISQVVGLIAQSFNYYYVAIFIVAENERWAELKDATGSAGQILKARRHRLQINSSSMVGSAISTREPQVALDVGSSAVRFNNPLLPNTRSEIAIPLSVGNRVIGALNVQSIRAGDFKPDDISTLQSMANQVAIAIENARLFKEMDQALDELRQTNRQYITSAWSDRLKSNRLEYTTGSAPIATDVEAKQVEVKLNLRDENIGQIRLETEGDWSLDDQAWVEALSTQVAISLENARLVEESQQAALRERLSASIVQKLWSTNSIDGILQTAVRELGRAMEASEATIELKVEE